MLDRLNENTYDLIVSEFNLSTTNVMEMLSLLSERTIEIPLIIISDTYNENDMVNAIKAGCRDYVVRRDISRIRTIILRIIYETERYTDRKINKELREEKRKLSVIFEATPVELVILDENLIVRRVNFALANQLGKSVENMINKKVGNSFDCINSKLNMKGCGYSKNCGFCKLNNIASEVIITRIPVYGKEIQHSLFIEGKKEDV